LPKNQLRPVGFFSPVFNGHQHIMDTLTFGPKGALKLFRAAGR
jgi:hypothetical protein